MPPMPLPRPRGVRPPDGLPACSTTSASEYLEEFKRTRMSRSDPLT